jgi:pyrimidine and pyridine-specific 5'-nucleotidase
LHADYLLPYQFVRWFAAHRNTITLASQNLVIHLQWQEHIVPLRKQRETKSSVDDSPPQSRKRADSTASNISTTSNATNKSIGQRKPSATTSSTPVKSTSASRVSSQGVNRNVTPSRLQSSNSSSQGNGSPSPVSPSPWPRSGTSAGINRSRNSLTPSTSSLALSPAVTTTTKGKEEIMMQSSSPGPSSSPTTPTSSTSGVNPSSRQTRIAPNLGVAPVVVDVLSTPEAAAGCVDPAKKRIVLASRFSSRAGADRRIYTSTLNEGSSSSSNKIQKQELSEQKEVEPTLINERKVVAIGGAWQASANELATPARNPMSLVLDHENCVVGTSEGIVYRMGFVRSDYTTGWVEEKSEAKENGVETTTSDHHCSSGTITDLLQLRSMWKDLF